jgi:hypothetical protein
VTLNFDVLLLRLQQNYCTKLSLKCGNAKLQSVVILIQ